MPNTVNTSPAASQPAASAPPATARPLRRDAELNRQRVLDAAAKLFAERGIDIGFDEIARVAGVGVGTVYRRFPDRATLLQALLTTRYEGIIVKLETLLGEDDPRGLLQRFCVQFVQEASNDAGFRDATFEHAEGDPLAEFHARMGNLFDTAIQRAKEAGEVRSDVVAEDLATLTTLLGHLRGDESMQLIPRYVSLVLEGLHPHAGQDPLPGSAPTPAQTMRLVQRNL